MDNTEERLARQRRLEHYNEMKPAYKGILGATLRGAFKMMKWMVKTAFQIPGMVKRASAPKRESKPQA